MLDTKLKGKVALVTGANHGIGEATARAFATQGANVFISYFLGTPSYTEDELIMARGAGIGGDRLYRAMQQQSAGPLVREISSLGVDVASCELDLGDPANIRKLYESCESQLGPVDVLVNNHTHCDLETFDPSLVSEARRISPTSAAGIDTHFSVNSRAYALMMAEYANRFVARRAEWGRIINVSTDAAHAHIANVSYAASKHAIESYSRSAAAELGKYGITVNIVAPGPIQTGYITPEMEAEITLRTPLFRLGAPADVADVIVFLASEQARWVTGQLTYVGGGYRMHQ